MKTSYYVKQARAIASADSGGIRERWLWGLRLLRDPHKMSSASSLKHGETEKLLAEAKAAGQKLSVREIQARLQCARAYPTEAQISRSTEDFEHWSALVQANFPPYEVPEGEPPADHRTEAEKAHDRARALADLDGDQETLFPLADFEPLRTTLEDLTVYTRQMKELTARFAARDDKRQAYLDRLVEAADYDLSTTWHDAQQRLVALNAAAGDDPVPDLPRQLSAA